MRAGRSRRWTAAVAGLLAAACLAACGDVAGGVELTLTFGPAWRTDEGARLQMLAAAASGSRDLVLHSYRLTIFSAAGQPLASSSGPLALDVLAGMQVPFELALLEPEEQNAIAPGETLGVELVIQGETDAGDGFSQGETADVTLP